MNLCSDSVVDKSAKITAPQVLAIYAIVLEAKRKPLAGLMLTQFFTHLNAKRQSLRTELYWGLGPGASVIQVDTLSLSAPFA
jgi:hypothetical protein